MSRLSSGLDEDPTPKKVLYAKSGPMADWSRGGVKTFFGGLIPEISFHAWEAGMQFQYLSQICFDLVNRVRLIEDSQNRPPQVNEHNLFLFEI